MTFRNKVTFFVGENGSGKSTLLEALAECCGFNPMRTGIELHDSTLRAMNIRNGHVALELTPEAEFDEEFGGS